MPTKISTASITYDYKDYKGQVTAGLSLRAGGRLLRTWPPATFVVKLNLKSTPLKHTKRLSIKLNASFRFK